MPLSPCVAAAILVAALASAAAANPPNETVDGAKVLAPNEIEWTAGPPALPNGASMATLEGDPTREGRYVLRIKLPDGYRLQPYVHPKSQRVTVISGTLHSGVGATFDPRATRALTAGAYARWPAGAPHFSWAEGETIVQLHGEGPWIINYVRPEDDPRPFRARNVIAFTDDPLEEVQANVASENAVLVDVRSATEWNQGHVEGSIFVPVTSLHKQRLNPARLAKVLPAKEEEKTLYTFCVVGMRAKQAAKVLQEQGYNVRALKPGYEQLVEAGFKKANEDTRQRHAR